MHYTYKELQKAIAKVERSVGPSGSALELIAITLFEEHVKRNGKYETISNDNLAFEISYSP